ncbi:MAG: nucleotidyltransferase [Eubacterium sp.]|nr:nucleotidyltransferase [Eubacterium sp.]
MKKTTLVIMAAGIGSRFGKGIKQIEPVGPSGQIIIDYSIRDAMEAGFSKVVFIIRKDIEADFREAVGKRIEDKIEVVYAFQEMDALPAGFTVPEGRTKPWGTGQAILSCKGLINEPFAVINADDYYGKEPYRKMNAYLSDASEKGDQERISMVAFQLGNTLSENGGVTRGVCRVNEKGRLEEITETFNIVKTGTGAAVMSGETPVPIAAETPVSMNLWGLQPSVLPLLEEGFTDFLAGGAANELKSEFLLPGFIDSLLKAGKAYVDVLSTTETWFGVTYQEDKASVKEAFRRLTDEGKYPEVF